MHWGIFFGIDFLASAIAFVLCAIIVGVILYVTLFTGAGFVIIPLTVIFFVNRHYYKRRS